MRPGSHQRLGWQSWDVVTTIEDSTQIPAGGNTSSGSDAASDGVDWWNVTDSVDQKVDFASLPLDVWSPLLPHDTGRASITSF